MEYNVLRIIMLIECFTTCHYTNLCDIYMYGAYLIKFLMLYLSSLKFQPVLPGIQQHHLVRTTATYIHITQSFPYHHPST